MCRGNVGAGVLSASKHPPHTLPQPCIFHNSLPSFYSFWGLEQLIEALRQMASGVCARRVYLIR